MSDALPFASTAIMHGDSGERLRFSLGRVEDPAASLTYPDQPDDKDLQPSAGHRLVTVTVLVENDGSVPFMPTVEKHTWLIDSKGHAYPHNSVMTRAHQSDPPSPLRPVDPESAGWAAAFRTIVFEIRADVRPVRFRLSLHPGVARKTQDWILAPG